MAGSTAATLSRMISGTHWASGPAFANYRMKDDTLDNLHNLHNLPAPDVLQQEIIEHLEAALSAFRDVVARMPRFPAKQAL